jgi:hypothetical protein
MNYRILTLFLILCIAYSGCDKDDSEQDSVGTLKETSTQTVFKLNGQVPSNGSPSVFTKKMNTEDVFIKMNMSGDYYLRAFDSVSSIEFGSFNLYDKYQGVDYLGFYSFGSWKVNQPRVSDIRISSFDSIGSKVNGSFRVEGKNKSSSGSGNVNLEGSFVNVPVTSSFEMVGKVPNHLSGILHDSKLIADSARLFNVGGNKYKLTATYRNRQKYMEISGVELILESQQPKRVSYYITYNNWRSSNPDSSYFEFTSIDYFNRVASGTFYYKAGFRNQHEYGTVNSEMMYTVRFDRVPF